MNFIDVSIFCDEYEKELCLLKLILEHNYVDKFVWCENEYDYRGRYKGQILQKMVDSDSRFSKYRDKIKIITVSKDFTDGDKSLQEQLDPPQFHLAEEYLRLSPKEYIINTYKDIDRVLVSDIDEVWDATDPKRRDKIFEAIKTHGDDPLQFERIRYTWDFDNRSWRSPMDIVTPCFTVDSIRSSKVKLSDKKWVGHHIPNGDNIAIFEYCFCFPYEGILSKYSSSLHTKWAKHKIDQSIKTNTWTMTSYQTISKDCRWHWFEKVKLTPKNSPAYVRENLDKLKTNLVPDTYKLHRINEFGISPHFPDNNPEAG